MTRREMVEELLEKLETELDELNNVQLSTLITEYEHAAILTSVVDGLGDVDADADEDEDGDDEKEELPLIDGDWDAENGEDEDEED